MPNNITLRPMEKTIEHWKANAEEDYITTPISVLRYISELEKTKPNIITESQVVDVMDLWQMNEISYDRMVEILNEIAAGKHKNGIEI